MPLVKKKKKCRMHLPSLNSQGSNDKMISNKVSIHIQSNYKIHWSWLRKHTHTTTGTDLEDLKLQHW